MCTSEGSSPFTVQILGSPQALVDLMGGIRDLPPGSKFFNFHAVLGKINCKTIPIWELVHPPWKNPGSTTVVYLVQGFEYEKFHCLRVACFPNMSITKFHVSVTPIAYDWFHWWY